MLTSLVLTIIRLYSYLPKLEVCHDGAQNRTSHRTQLNALYNVSTINITFMIESRKSEEMPVIKINEMFSFLRNIKGFE